MANEFQLPFLGQIPLDHRLGQSCDEGLDFFEAYSDTATAAAFIELANGTFSSFFFAWMTVQSNASMHKAR